MSCASSPFASEAGSPMNRLGSGQRRDRDQGPVRHKTYIKYLDKVYLMIDYLKFKNTGQHWTCFTKAWWAWHATIYSKSPDFSTLSIVFLVTSSRYNLGFTHIKLANTISASHECIKLNTVAAKSWNCLHWTRLFLCSTMTMELLCPFNDFSLRV